MSGRKKHPRSPQRRTHTHYAIAPDGLIPNSIIRQTMSDVVHPLPGDTEVATERYRDWLKKELMKSETNVETLSSSDSDLTYFWESDEEGGDLTQVKSVARTSENNETKKCGEDDGLGEAIQYGEGSSLEKESLSDQKETKELDPTQMTRTTISNIRQDRSEKGALSYSVVNGSAINSAETGEPHSCRTSARGSLTDLHRDSFDDTTHGKPVNATSHDLFDDELHDKPVNTSDHDSFDDVSRDRRNHHSGTVTEDEEEQSRSCYVRKEEDSRVGGSMLTGQTTVHPNEATEDVSNEEPKGPSWIVIDDPREIVSMRKERAREELQRVSIFIGKKDTMKRQINEERCKHRENDKMKRLLPDNPAMYEMFKKRNRILSLINSTKTGIS